MKTLAYLIDQYFEENLIGEFPNRDIPFIKEIIRDFVANYLNIEDNVIIGWVDVNERLPNCWSQHRHDYGSGYLLGYTKCEEITITQFWKIKQEDGTYKKYWEVGEELREEDYITHWMPLPKEPKTKKINKMENLEQAIFIDGIHEYDYVYVEDENTHFLYYSRGASWNQDIKGTLAFYIQDTGDGYEFSKCKNKGKLGYDEMEKFMILLKFIPNYGTFQIATLKDL